MLQRKNKSIIAVVCLLCILSVSAIVSAAYLSTNRDTRKAPAAAKTDLTISTGYELIHSTDKVEYYFREDRDVLAVRDIATGYIWKTGLDVPFKDQIEDAKEALISGDQEEIEKIAKRNDWTVEQLTEIANTPMEEALTDKYTGIANSLLMIEYFEGTGDQMTTDRTSSAAEKEDEGESALKKVGSDSSKWVLQVTFEDLDLGVNVYLTLGDDGEVTYDIPYEEITGKGIDKLASMSITPFLGASGGTQLLYDPATEDWETPVAKEVTPGYVFVPDGSGSLIRFTRNTATFTQYIGDVYGANPSDNLQYYQELDTAVPVESPVMPVFGVSHGDGTQSAFVAYATSGDEYMQINASPQSEQKNQMRYTYAYPKFVYDVEYFQVTTQAGATYRKTRDDNYKFDVSVTYNFLFGDGSDGTPKADYTGMAKVYREHLLEEGIIELVDFDYDDVPIRLDFLMSDSKKGIVSTTPVIMTTTDDVDEILTSVLENGIKNVNSGLIGWQKNGEALSKPNKAKFTGKIGSKKDFTNLVSSFNKAGVDISLSRDFTTINNEMIMYYGNAAKHNNTQYLSVDKTLLLPENAPVMKFGYATPEKTAQWITDLHEGISKVTDSMTLTGVSNNLVSTHESDGTETTVTEAIKLYEEAIGKVAKDTTISMDSPNAYLWKYVDRYLQSPVGSSQYVYETDAVPFLQMVLHGTMEMYAPYSNFSFYSKADMLRMIDYNISPSFILTKQPSYLLASTVSCDYYSTEYDQYEELIQSIYNTVNDALSQVIGYEWTGRTVLEEGVIANSYSDGSSEKTIVINYTDESYDFNNTRVDAESAKVIEGGMN